MTLGKTKNIVMPNPVEEGNKGEQAVDGNFH
jgi:hypothetical protein